jgi:hypothetical protein
MPIQLPDSMFAVPEIVDTPQPPPDPMVAREQQIADTTRAEQGLNQFLAAKQNMLFDAPDAFYRQQGEDAIHATPVTTQKLDDLRNDLLDRLGNDAQRNRLRNALDAQMELTRDGMSRHVAEQSEAWQRQVAQDRIALLAKEAAHHHNDDELIDALGHAAANAARAHSRVGDGPPGGNAEDAAAATARRGAPGAAIQARLDRGDTVGANALFTQVQDQLDPEHAAPLRAQIEQTQMPPLLAHPEIVGHGTIEPEAATSGPDEAAPTETGRAPGQNSSGIVPVNAGPDDAIGAAQANPQLAQAPSVAPLFLSDASPEPLRPGQQYAAGDGPSSRRLSPGGRDLTPREEIRWDFFNLHRAELEKLEPNNSRLSYIAPTGWVPSQRNVDEMAREVANARARAVARSQPGAAAESSKDSDLSASGLVRRSVPSGIQSRTSESEPEARPKLSPSERAAVNFKMGQQYEQDFNSELQRDKLEIGPQLTLETPSGKRTRVDFVTRHPTSGEIRCIECKASETAPLTRNQREAFPEIGASGATVKGAGKPEFPGGTYIPPTNVQIMRKR